ncbi:hypothetical protein Bca52824_084959 [Brassica carinata]|uniref:Sulfurtransferase n=1 Tax=Brassica carinata TaxID=52824 RepID=A0A8X7PQH1_BRACI|nr:hypothetical protein Bca52824_084959 [Brassica carinata]
MASTLFSRAFLAASRRLITPSLLAETTLNLAAFLSKRSFYSQLGASSTWARRAMASSGVGGKAGYSTSSVPTNMSLLSLLLSAMLNIYLVYVLVQVLDASWYMPEEQRNLIQEYQVAHVPGALFFDLDGISDRSTSLPHMLPSEEAFAAGCSALGIENKNGVVVYDAKGIYSAARVWWMFRAFGHNKVWVLDGGLPRWRASGYDVESSASGDAILKASAASEAIEKIYQGQTVSPITFQTKFQQHLVWSLDQVKKNMEDQTYQHIDARSKARFDGTAPEPRKGIRSGHIPGSKCVPFPQLLDSSQTLLPAEEVKKRFEQEGSKLFPLHLKNEFHHMNQGLHRLGKTDVPVYDGSWNEWATEPDLPMEGAESSS